MDLEMTEELGELYSVYKSLLKKEIECTNKVLAAKTIDERNAFIEKATRFSKEASSVARVIKEIEDTGEDTPDPGDKPAACQASPGE
nr:hypothetical protein [Candidatus Sigynarchaeum springense]